MSLRRAAAVLALAAATLALAGAAAPAPPPPTALRIMTIGDSLNTGLGSPDGCGYRTELARLLTTAGVAVTFTGVPNGTGPQDCPLPYGHHGATVQALLYGADNGQPGAVKGGPGSVDEWMAADTPDVVLVQIGTNNAMGTPPGFANFQTDYQDLVQRILNASATVKVVFSYVPYSVAPWAANEVSANVAIIYASWTVAAAYPGRTILVNSSRLPCKFLSDGIHPYYYDPIARWYYDGLVTLYGLPPVPSASFYFLDQPRPGYERPATTCPA